VSAHGDLDAKDKELALALLRYIEMRFLECSAQSLMQKRVLLMDEKENQGVPMEDPLQAALMDLLTELPAFARSEPLVSGEVDARLPYMVFEALGRFLADRSLRDLEDPEVCKGFEILNRLMERPHGEAANLVVVTVLEQMAEDTRFRNAALPLLNEQMRDALTTLLEGEQFRR